MSNRIYFLDVAKVLGTFLVVFAHLYSIGSPMRIPIYAFHMPFFFLVSGIFHKYNGTVQTKKYTKSLLVPLAIFITMALLYEPFMASLFDVGSIMDQSVSFLKKTIKGIALGGNIGIYWFLIVLFLCKFSTDLFLKSKKKKAIIALYITFLVLSCITKLPLYISQTVMALPFYMLGYIYRDKFKELSLERIGEGKILLFSIICFVVTIALSALNGKVSMIAVSFGHLPIPLNIATFYVNALVGSFMLLSVSLLVRKKFNIIKIISESLITIVGIQGLFTHAFKYVWGYDQNVIYSSIASIIIIIVCSIIHKPLSKIYIR